MQPETTQSIPALIRSFRSAIVLAGVGALVAATINNIPTYNEQVTSTWSDVEVQYQRRAELVPNLLEVVRKAGDYEQETLLKVTEARSRLPAAPQSAHDNEGMQQYEVAQAEMGVALSQLMIQVERYPELKANRNYLTLMSQLEGTENRIALVRSRFVAAIAQYNTELRTFPGKIWQPILYSDLQSIDAYYKATAANADQAPVVKL
jgi:LemA protein